MDQRLTLDPDLIRKYDTSGPRYTSYPTAVQFHPGFGEAQYRECAQLSNRDDRAGDQVTGVTDEKPPLSLYFHIPFCDTVCFYCACNKVVTKNRDKAEPYLRRLYKEIQMQSELFDVGRPVAQLHWGGGTPTFISHRQMAELMQHTCKHFHLLDDDQGEYSIEIDPREVDDQTIGLLRALGFNRLSLGVQDFDPLVQKAVNRIQSESETFSAIDAARREGFKSISVDLIYGLPFQNSERFVATLNKVLEAQPDRLSVFNYAHLPTMFKPQRRINEKDLPSAREKLAILRATGERLEQAGYVYIGMDHFAKPGDELAIAQREGKLYRNFQGYSTHADCDLLAMGITSISKVGDCYAQNVKDMDAYFEHIDADRLPLMRGIKLSGEDKLRREVIRDLMCHFGLDFAAIGTAFNIDFADHFGEEIAALEGMREDGLIEMDDQGIQVTGAGRLLIRNICMVFDAYLANSQNRFSKVI